MVRKFTFIFFMILLAVPAHAAWNAGGTFSSGSGEYVSP